ncbi:ankyrin repeat domain-containing protein [Priestia iocasae]|uniref:Zn-dependent protease with chaperone function n=1 Tax=Priestia iocasae TaxID=2291674 RepID=A0ABS2QVD5_9BACI|nr:Zn-dependent protease with chaperone function [Metabacillus iocasae]
MVKEKLIEKELVYPYERRYFALVLVLSILTYVGLGISIVGIFIVAAMIFLSLFIHGLMIGYIRTNAVRLNERQFPKVYEKTKQLCSEMGLQQVPDVYVMQSGGALNAFATRFFGRNMVVLYAEIFELIEQGDEDELSFVIAHELAHIKRNHISKSLFILPTMWLPGIGEMYLRACEYTCDRYAAYYTNNAESAKNGLTVLSVGKLLYKHVNRDEFLKQAQEEKGFFAWFSEFLSTHPPLPKRIHEVGVFMGETGDVILETKRSKKVWLFVPIILLLFGGCIAGMVYSMNYFFDKTIGEFEESVYGEPSPFTQAIITDDIDELQRLIEEGYAVDDIDDQGYTSLHWAAKSDNIEAAALLLNEGVNVDIEDGDMFITPLMSAAELGNSKMMSFLIEQGADVEYEDSDGYTALTHAVYSDNVEAVRVLIEAGANPNASDYYASTPLMKAVENGNAEITTLLKQAAKKGK